MTSPLPDGWTVERLRSVSGDQEARPLPPDRRVTVDVFGQEPDVILPAFVLSFHDLCLVQPAEEDDWYMGNLDADGSIACWASYGTDLEEAIRGL